MPKNSKSNLIRTIKQATKELEKFEIAEKAWNNLLAEVPEGKFKERINIIVNLKEVDANTLEFRVKELTESLIKSKEKYILLLEKVNSDERLKIKYSTLNQFDLNAKEEEIEKTIAKFKHDKFHQKRKEDLANWVLSFPIVNNKTLGLENFETVDEVKSHFSEEYDEIIQCGQGIYQDKGETFCYVKDRLFKVTLYADVLSNKVEYGDRIYYVDKIKNVELEGFDQNNYLKLIKEQKDKLIKEKEAELKFLKKNRVIA